MAKDGKRPSRTTKHEMNLAWPSQNADNGQVAVLCCLMNENATRTFLRVRVSYVEETDLQVVKIYRSGHHSSTIKKLFSKGKHSWAKLTVNYRNN